MLLNVVYAVELLSFPSACSPQFDVLWPDLSAMEHLRLFGQLRGLAAGGTLDLALQEQITRFHMGDMVDVHAQNMSGGMKRRLSMAISTLHTPRLLFLDEPTTYERTSRLRCALGA